MDRFLDPRTVLLPKPNKDLTLSQSYRPIALLNQDYHLLTKILAIRLQSYLPTFFNSAQQGFINQRHLSENTRILGDCGYNLCSG